MKDFEYERCFKHISEIIDFIYENSDIEEKKNNGIFFIILSVSSLGIITELSLQHIKDEAKRIYGNKISEDHIDTLIDFLYNWRKRMPTELPKTSENCINRLKSDNELSNLNVDDFLNSLN